jgi:hypothetical protein
MRNLVLILTVLAWIPFCWQPLRGQPPGVGINAPKKQPNNATGDAKATGTRGTKDDPFIVDTFGHQETPAERKKADEQAAEAKAQEQYHRDIDRRTLIWNCTTALATVVLVLVGIGGVFAALRTLWAVEAQGVLLAREFELSHRPWVAVDLAVTDTLAFDSDGLKMPLRFTLRNTGNSPALRTFIDAVIDANWDEARVDANWIWFCSKPNSGLGKIIGVSLFPGSTIIRDETFIVTRKMIEENLDPTEGRFLKLTIMGKVGYEFSFAERECQSPFIY